MFLGLELFHYFFTREEYLVGFSLGTLGGLIIFIGERSLVGLSLGLPLGFPLEYPNPGAVLDYLYVCLSLMTFGVSLVNHL